jgi:hypothetical protein
MRISYRTHPALKFLIDGLNSDNLTFGERDREWIEMNHSVLFKNFKKNTDDYKSKIFYVTDPFIEAVNLSKEKLKDLYLSDLKEGEQINVSGTYVTKNLVLMVNYLSKEGSDEICIFGFSKSGSLLFFLFTYGAHIKYSFISKNGVSPNATVDSYLLSVVIIDYFIKYASVETDYLPPSKKVSIMNCNYLNDTKLPITHLDSKWFTTLIKSDAFKVRGHFRLQPKKKDGEWTKELIWINDFQKDGYTSPARKLNQ